MPAQGYGPFGDLLGGDRVGKFVKDSATGAERLMWHTVKVDRKTGKTSLVPESE
jgi:hypothetical protein